MQAVYALLEPTPGALLGRGASCISVVRSYLPDTEGHGCRLLKPCQDLPPTNCGAGGGGGADSFSCVKTYPPSTVG